MRGWSIAALACASLVGPACADLGALFGGKPRPPVVQDEGDSDAGPDATRPVGGKTGDQGGSPGASPAPGQETLAATVDGPFIPTPSAEVVR